MKIAVFEDDKVFASKLETIICRHTHYPTCCNTDNADLIIKYINTMQEPTIFLLDIVANNITIGLEIANKIETANNGSLIIFISNYPDLIMTNANYKTMCLSLILKSNHALVDELCATIDKAASILKRHCLLIKHSRFETLYISIQQITYIEKIKGTNKIAIHCLDGEYIVPSTLKKILRELNRITGNGQFVQCQKSFLINRMNVLRIDRSAKEIQFRKGGSCPYGIMFAAYVFCTGGLHEYLYIHDGRQRDNLQRLGSHHPIDND